MGCIYADKIKISGNIVAVIGTRTTVFEGVLLPDTPIEACYYTKEELRDCGFDVIESVEVADKYKAFQEFVQMALRCGCKFETNKIPYTHEEKVRLANEFLNRFASIPRVAYSRVVGSVAQNMDRPLSDVGIEVLVKDCPGEECEISRLVKEYVLEPIDLWCKLRE